MVKRNWKKVFNNNNNKIKNKIGHPSLDLTCYKFVFKIKRSLLKSQTCLEILGYGFEGIIDFI